MNEIKEMIYMERYPMVNDDFDLFDDVFGVPMFGREPLMRTDVEEKDNGYVMKMDLPGYKKEDIHISLQNENLSIEAERKESNEEKNSKGAVLREERFTGKCSRTFYVGKNVKDTDIRASFNDGTLTVTVPKVEEVPEENRFLAID